MDKAAATASVARDPKPSIDFSPRSRFASVYGTVDESVLGGELGILFDDDL